MKNLTKKIMIYSMAGMMQIGLGATVGATVIEASAFDNGGSQIVQLDRHDGERHHHHHYRDDRNDDNDNTMNEIAAGAIGFVLGSAIH